MVVSIIGRGWGPAAKTSAAVTTFSLEETTNLVPKFELIQGIWKINEHVIGIFRRETNASKSKTNWQERFAIPNDWYGILEALELESIYKSHENLITQAEIWNHSPKEKKKKKDDTASIWQEGC